MVVNSEGAKTGRFSVSKPNLSNVPKSAQGWMDIRKATAEDPVPEAIWPNLDGVIKAEVVTWEPTAANWAKFWKVAQDEVMVSVDTETDGLYPFKGNRICGVAAAYFDGKKIQAGYWNFRHRGHGKHEVTVEAAKKFPEEERKLLKEVKAKGKLTGYMCQGFKESAPVMRVGDLQAMVPVLERCVVAGQNYKFDQRFFWVDGLKLPARVIDSMLVAHLFNSGNRTFDVATNKYSSEKRSYSLAALGAEMGEEKLGDSIKEYMDRHGLKVEETGHAEVAHYVEEPYAVRDTVLVLRRLQWERERWLALNDPRLMEVFQVENNSSISFSMAEINGAKLDLPFISRSLKKLDSEMSDLERQIYKEAAKQIKALKWGKKFDILSGEQLWRILEMRGLKPLAFTPSGDPVTDEDALVTYNDEFCNLVHEYRLRHKVANTYLRPFAEKHADADGYLHPDFVIQGTVTGRISCREPNLQNIPRFERFGSRNTARGRTSSNTMMSGISTGQEFRKTKEETIETRRCFVPRSKDHTLFFFDYAQMELRIFAEYVQEKYFIENLAKGVDIHEMVARKIFPIFPESKAADGKLYEYLRQMAKQISFGLIYGMGVNKLALQLNVPVDEAVRSLEMLRRVHTEYDKKLAASCSALTMEEVEGMLEDHRVMTTSRQWDGLRALEREVQQKVTPKPLEAFLTAPERKMENFRYFYSAKTFMKEYHGQFPTIKQLSEGIKKAIGSRGYIFNKYGRRYFLPPDKAYVGVNRIIQGSCSDMVKHAQNRVYDLLRGTKTVSYFTNQVHDEFQMDIHDSEIATLVPKVKFIMEDFPEISVKMKVDVSCSKESWADKVDWAPAGESK